MKNGLFSYIGTLGCLVILLVHLSCNSPDDIIPKPVISISNANPNLWNENITGYVHGIVALNYKIAIYGKLNMGWYNLPNRDTPLLTIAEDNSWACPLSIDQIAAISEYSIFLIPNGYSPPILAGAKMIPVKLNIVAAAKANILIE